MKAAIANVGKKYFHNTESKTCFAWWADIGCKGAKSIRGEGVTAIDPAVSRIQSAAELGAESFAAKMANSSLDAAIDVWLKRVAQRKCTPTQRARLLKAVERGTAAETVEIQLTRAALLRAVGLDEGPAAAAAATAGATYAEIGAVLGISGQGVGQKVRAYRDRSADGSHPGGLS